MRNWTTKKRVFAAMCVGVLAIAGAAVAYFTTTGSGSATATVGSSTPVTIKATVGGTLYPGVSQTVTFTVDNPSPGAQRVNTITVTGITPDAGHSSCLTTLGGGTADFSISPVVVNKTYGPGNNQAVTPTGTLTMNDTGISQNGCQGATLTLAMTSN